MNQKLIFCIAFLVIFCCDISISLAAVENSVSDFDDINKTLTIYDNESKVMTVRLISAVSDISTFTEIFKVSNFEAYTPDSKSDFTARTATVVGSGAVTDTEWFIEQNTSYIVNVTDYGIKEVEEIIFNNKTGKNETVLVNKTVITGYHDETRYKVTWIDYQPYANEMKKDQVLKIKVVYHKVPELGPFRIQTVPMFRGVECSELTWWSGSWDRRRAILINNTGGDSVTDYQLKSVNLSSYNINALSTRIVNSTSNLQESFWNRSVDANGNLEYVWCNFSNLPSGVWINTTYYVYYQSSPSVSSVSSIFNTGITGSDDFSNGTGLWSEQSGAILITSSIASVNPTANHGGVRSINTFSLTDGIIIEAYQQYEDVVDTQNSIGLSEVSGATSWYNYNTIIMRATGAQNRWESWGKTAYDVWGVGTLDTDWHTVKVTAEVGSNGIVEVSGESGTKSPSWSIASDTYYMWLVKAYDTYQVTHVTNIDYVLIRKYTPNEPEPWTVGAEEEYSAPIPTPTPALTTSISLAQYDELDLPLILYILMISMLYLLIVFRHGVAAVELSFIYLIFAFFFLLFQTVTIFVNYIYLTLFLLLFMISIAGITLDKRSW